MARHAPFLCITACCAASIWAPVFADQPLHDPDNGAITGIYHFPDSTEGAMLVPAGRSSFSASLVTSSHSIDQRSGSESLLLDGETTRFQLSYRRGLGERWEVGLDVPFLWHSEGSLDGLIENWHDLFGLPDGARVGREQDQLEFVYQNAIGSPFDIQRSNRGVGDLRLTAGRSLGGGETWQSALRLAVTVPSGESAELHGTGAPGLSIGYAADSQELGGNAAFNAYYRVHASWMSEPDLLADRYRSVVGHFAAGLGYSVTPRFELRLQTLVRSAVYDSGIEVLGEPSVVLTFGGNIRLSPEHVLSLAVGEDIKVSSAPDVSFQVALRYAPR